MSTHIYGPQIIIIYLSFEDLKSESSERLFGFSEPVCRQILDNRPRLYSSYPSKFFIPRCSHSRQADIQSVFQQS